MIHSLKESSPVYDDIKHVIKYVTSQIIAPLAHFINLSLESGIFPDDLKTAKIIILLKKGDLDILFDYRPISSLIYFSKLFEEAYSLSASIGF